MTVQLYATNCCRDCRAAKQFLNAHGIPYTEIDVDANPVASAEVIEHAGKRAVPQLVIDGEWFQPYTPGRGLLVEELERRLHIARV
ncbi:MAG: glutaredoxin family protein [Terracidiphilus sp.]|jgi:glutaredoxin